MAPALRKVYDQNARAALCGSRWASLRQCGGYYHYSYSGGGRLLTRIVPVWWGEKTKKFYLRGPAARPRPEALL